jgi:signal transduction histidine kinase
MFHKSATKLTGLYLAIVMVISLFFSLVIYQLSTQELDRWIHRPEPVINILPDRDTGLNLRQRLEDSRMQYFNEAKHRVISRLVIINVCILAGGGVLSYYLARRTLNPIEEAHAALERFTGDASHELRTPITAMRSENEVALMNPKLTLAQAKKQLQSNIEELEKLTTLTEGLLRLTSLDPSELPKKAAGLDEMIHEAIAKVEPKARAKHITILAESLIPQKVVVNRAGIVEVLVSLLDNAIKYSPADKTIRITTAVDGKHATINVTDHGMGIKAVDLPHIFERFYRADAARSKQDSEGYGLGLAIAQDIVTLHEGQLTVTSRPERGSTFSLRLPLK